jgi:hypothetical protein
MMFRIRRFIESPQRLARAAMGRFSQAEGFRQVDFVEGRQSGAMNRTGTMTRRKALDMLGASSIAAVVAILRPDNAAIGTETAESQKAIVLIRPDSLVGWKPTDFFRAGTVSVKEGVLTLGKGAPMTGVTWQGEELPRTDFELAFTARRVEGDDFFAAVTFPVGEGFLTFVNGGWSGAVTGLSSIDGADASENETNCQFDFVNGTWYRFVLRVSGLKVVVTVDGKTIVDFDGTERSLKTRVESRPSQPLGFACYGCIGEIKDATLKRIPAKP